MSAAIRRNGPFWDAAAGRRPLPPAAATLGLELIEADVENGTIELAFEATHDFTTPRGDVSKDSSRLEAELFDPLDNVVAIGLGTARITAFDSPG